MANDRFVILSFDEAASYLIAECAYLQPDRLDRHLTFASISATTPHFRTLSLPSINFHLVALRKFSPTIVDIRYVFYLIHN